MNRALIKIDAKKKIETYFEQYYQIEIANSWSFFEKSHSITLTLDYFSSLRIIRKRTISPKKRIKQSKSFWNSHWWKTRKQISSKIFFIQTLLNNSSNNIIEISPHEILYEFRILNTIDLLNNDEAKLKTEDENPITEIEKKNIFRTETKNAINFEQTIQKIKYDLRHKFLNFKKKNKIYFRLHNDYNQPGLTNRKFDKQKIESISILKKMGKLTYRLDIFSIWKIHSIVFVTHLKSILTENDPFNRKTTKSNSIEMKRKFFFDLYEVKKIVAKKIVRTERNRNHKSHSEFRVKWSGWRNQHNKWMKRDQLNECAKLLIEFESTERLSNIEWNSRRKSPILKILIHFNFHRFGTIHSF